MTYQQKPTILPPYPFLNAFSWLQDKQKADGAEDLWRIHDNLYDLTTFVDSHPGGSEWLKLTKGTDITEAFEVHHLTTKPEKLLPTYFKKKATLKRNSPFTFKEDGFYKTLKREVMKVLPNVPKETTKRSELITDTLFVTTFLFAVLANATWNYGLGLLAGILLGGVTIAAHNYLHQKDNFRMYYFNISLMQTKQWRITHALSHHLFTNTIWDTELVFVEPFVSFRSKKRPFIFNYIYCLSFPIYWAGSFHGILLKRLVGVLRGNLSLLAWYDFIPYTLPLVMHLTGNESLFGTIWMWTFILAVGSFCATAVGLNGTHHHPDVFHEGDTPRTVSDYDWGLGQLDTVMGRPDIIGSPLLVLTAFGDHALHHLFPSLDHGTLDLLYPTFKRVCKQFNVDLRTVSTYDLLKGSFLQVLKTEPNPHPPDLLKKY